MSRCFTIVRICDKCNGILVLRLGSSSTCMHGTCTGSKFQERPGRTLPLTIQVHHFGPSSFCVGDFFVCVLFSKTTMRQVIFIWHNLRFACKAALVVASHFLRKIYAPLRSHCLLQTLTGWAQHDGSQARRGRATKQGSQALPSAFDQRALTTE